MKLADAVEAPQDKPLDPHVALEKVLRLDRKHTNFDYSDPIRKVQNPLPLNDAPPNQHLLRQFWRHAHNYYFRRPQESEIDRLSYFSTILNEELSDELPFRLSQEMWRQLELTFNPEYLRRRTESLETNLDGRNWLCTLYLYYRLLENSEAKSNKKIEKEYHDLANARAKIELQSNHRRFNQSLRLENQQLIKLLPKLNTQEDEVTHEIRRLEKQLEASHTTTTTLFNQLCHRVSKEQQLKREIFCFGDDEDRMDEEFPEGDNAILEEISDENELQQKYLLYTINCLEKKQIAESISKITKIEKTRGEVKYLISFEEAMNVKRKSLTEAELLRLNKIREYSLFKFYNTSLKTPYSFICQNFFGFREIHLHRNEPCKYTNKNILEQMNKIVPEPLEVTRAFQKFDICHHCKLLYPENFLTKCKYSSDKMGIPIQPAPYSDSYLTQISKSNPQDISVETTKSQRYSMRKRNRYQNYTKVGDEYQCNRKFCRFCMKQNYDDGLDKNGLCPFCRGVCFCTRCSRNDMIVRLRGIYLMLGGPSINLLSDKFLEIENYEDAEEEQKEIRKKGRPKKILKRLSATPNKAYEHINTIRNQLEPLRLLCDLIKKREKKKEKLIETKQQFFLEKVGILNKNKDFTNILKNGRNHESTGQEDSESGENIQVKTNGHGVRRKRGE